MSTLNTLLPFHKQFPDKFRSQTLFGQYEKIYRRPPTLKKNSKEYKKLQSQEKIKLSKVIDFRNINQNEQIHKDNIILLSSNTSLKMYGYKSLPGLYFLPNYLTTSQQFNWIKQSIQQLSDAPYNNLTNLYSQLNNNNQIPTWKDAVKQNNFKQFRQLTWSNIGIKYDWTEREYNLNHITSEIPSDMINLCNGINQLLSSSNTCNYNHGITTNNGKDCNGLTFKMDTVPQTSIINFFEVNTKRPMGGHRDAAELINAPLISVSLGNTAIFLISSDDNIQPVPLWLKSGDVLIMAGKSRFALHCVARVVPNTCSDKLLKYFDNEILNNINDIDYRKELKLMKLYMKETRINFNIRQVIDVDKLPSSHDIHDISHFHAINSF